MEGTRCLALLGEPHEPHHELHRRAVQDHRRRDDPARREQDHLGHFSAVQEVVVAAHLLHLREFLAVEELRVVLAVMDDHRQGEADGAAQPAPHDDHRRLRLELGAH